MDSYKFNPKGKKITSSFPISYVFKENVCNTQRLVFMSMQFFHFIKSFYIPNPYGVADT